MIALMRVEIFLKRLGCCKGLVREGGDAIPLMRVKVLHRR